MQKQLRHTVAAIALLGPVFLAAPIAAQAQATARQPVITGLQMRADTGLARGSQLHFTVQGTPNGRAEVRINDTGIVVPLRQISAGVYDGTYTVQGGDRIDANGLLRVSVISGSQSTTTNYTFPQSFIAWQNNNQRPSAPPVAAGPEIDRFTARPDGALEPGAVVRFTLHGAPGGQASLNIPGVARNLAMDEQRPGVYRGSYTVRRQDNPDAFSSAAAVLRLGNQQVTANLTEPFAAGRPNTGTMGAAPMTLQPTITSHSNNDSIDRNGTTEVRGRTAPFASVRVRVDAVPPLIGQRLGVAQQVVSETVQADAQGNFAFSFNSRSMPLPGTRYEVSITANGNGQTAESRLTLMQRG